VENKKGNNEALGKGRAGLGRKGRGGGSAFEGEYMIL